MRVALFAAGGEIPAHALRALSGASSVVAIIRPAPDGRLGAALRSAARRVLRRTPVDELSRLAAELGIPELRMRGVRDGTLASRLSALRLDLGCIATFPWPLPPPILSAPRLGTLNVHASLLPRHRGPNPWFWTYHADDREAGVTVHHAEARVDRGAIVAQARWPLARGHPVAHLHAEVAERGAALLASLLPDAERRLHEAQPQDDALATRAPRVRGGQPMLDPGWPAERTWHFLAGLVGQYREPLHSGGRPVRYAQVPGFDPGPPEAGPGTVQPDGPGRWRLWCHDGSVRLLERAP